MATKILGMTALTKLVDKTKKYVNDKKMLNVMNEVQVQVETTLLF